MASLHNVCRRAGRYGDSKYQRRIRIILFPFQTGIFSTAVELLNVGIIEALKIQPDLDCFILHDVDTLPETNFAIYKCHEDRRFALQLATYQRIRDYR